MVVRLSPPASGCVELLLPCAGPSRPGPSRIRPVVWGHRSAVTPSSSLPGHPRDTVPLPEGLPSLRGSPPDRAGRVGFPGRAERPPPTALPQRTHPLPTWPSTRPSPAHLEGHLAGPGLAQCSLGALPWPLSPGGPPAPAPHSRGRRPGGAAGDCLALRHKSLKPNPRLALPSHWRTWEGPQNRILAPHYRRPLWGLRV